MVHFFRSNHIFRGTEQVKEPDYLTDVIARESCEVICRNKDEFFFLYKTCRRTDGACGAGVAV